MVSAGEIKRLLMETHPEAGCELKFNSVFELLVSVILSAQCTDKRVNAVTRELFKRYDTPRAFAALSEEELGKLIFSCGFYRNKAKNIIAASREILSKYGGRVPDAFDELINLPGVGRKTANVVLAAGFNKPAIAVDTHVFRVANRLGIAKGKTPDEVERNLTKFFQPEDYTEIHHLLIFHGRYVCAARKPDCADCLLKGLCEYAQNNK